MFSSRFDSLIPSLTKAAPAVAPPSGTPGTSSAVDYASELAKINWGEIQAQIASYALNEEQKKALQTSLAAVEVAAENFSKPGSAQAADLVKTFEIAREEFLKGFEVVSFWSEIIPVNWNGIQNKVRGISDAMQKAALQSQLDKMVAAKDALIAHLDSIPGFPPTRDEVNTARNLFDTLKKESQGFRLAFNAAVAASAGSAAAVANSSAAVGLKPASPVAAASATASGAAAPAEQAAPASQQASPAASAGTPDAAAPAAPIVQQAAPAAKQASPAASAVTPDAAASVTPAAQAAQPLTVDTSASRVRTDSASSSRSAKRSIAEIHETLKGEAYKDLFKVPAGPSGAGSIEVEIKDPADKTRTITGVTLTTAPDSVEVKGTPGQIEKNAEVIAQALFTAAKASGLEGVLEITGQPTAKTLDAIYGQASSHDVKVAVTSDPEKDAVLRLIGAAKDEAGLKAIEKSIVAGSDDIQAAIHKAMQETRAKPGFAAAATAGLTAAGAFSAAELNERHAARAKASRKAHGLDGGSPTP